MEIREVRVKIEIDPLTRVVRASLEGQRVVLPLEARYTAMLRGSNVSWVSEAGESLPIGEHQAIVWYHWSGNDVLINRWAIVQ